MISNDHTYIVCQTSNSASSSKFHHLALLALIAALVSYSSNFYHWPLLALLFALVLHLGDSASFCHPIVRSLIKVPVSFCGEGCVTHLGDEECQDKTTDVLHDIPGTEDMITMKMMTQSCRGGV